MAKYTSENIKTTKQFNRACINVGKGFGSKSVEFQELLILAVKEAARKSGGQVTNNLTWLTQALITAEETKGINFTKVVRYVKEALCCNTVAWSKAKSQLTKSSKKDVVLSYNTEPESTWFDYGKPNNLEKEFNYTGRITTSINSAISKGEKSTIEVVQAIFASDAITLDIILEAVAEMENE